MRRLRAITKAARNESRKLLATTVNAVGLAVFGFGVVSPGFGRDVSTTVATIVLASVMFVGLHLTAQRVVRRVED